MREGGASMSASPQAPDGIVPPLSSRNSIRETLWRWWIHRLWFVHPGLDLIVTLPPMACMRLLAKTSKPDVRQLEFRNLFAGGRRYHLYPTETGFVIQTSSKVPWRYRGRTSPSSVVRGEIEVEGDHTRIHLTARIKVSYILSSLLVPLFITSMVFYMPWLFLIKVAVILSLFGLSWIGHRFNAALEAYEIFHFIHQVLDPYTPEEALTLNTGQDVVYDATRFAAAWETFYHNLKQEA
jgi:hypothetical protein